MAVIDTKAIAKRWLSKKQRDILDKQCGPGSTPEEWEEQDKAQMAWETLTEIINAARGGNVDAAMWLEEREMISLPKKPISVTEDGLRMGTRIEAVKASKRD